MFDYEMLQRQLMRVGIGENPDDSQILDAIEVLAYTLDSLELTPYARNEVLQLFSSVGLEQLQSASEDMHKGSRWVEFWPGDSKLTDIVRVRLNAYSTPSGMQHNGRVGRLVSVFGDRIEVRYIGRYADIVQTHHKKYLEALK